MPHGSPRVVTIFVLSRCNSGEADGDRQRDALARRGRQRAFAERAGQAEVALQRGGAVGDETGQVGHDAELLLDGFDQRSRTSGSVGDRGGGWGGRTWGV